MPAAMGGKPWRPIMVLGDSILRGQSLDGRADLQTFVTAWLAPLAWPLTLTAGYNQAVSGETSTQILARAAAALTQIPSCWGVILDAGVNDYGVANVAQATCIQNIKDIIDLIHGIGAPVGWVDILPTATLSADARRTATNSAIDAYLGGHSRDFAFDTSWYNQATMSLDGTHPNTLGCSTGATNLATAAHAAGWI